MVAFTFGLTSCSSDDHEPIPEPEEEVILTPIPDGAEPGKIYAISHDKKKDVCTFQLYFGKTRAEELGEAYMGARAIVKALDSRGNILFEYLLHAPDTPDSVLYLGARLDTFTVYCHQCEAIRSFESVIYDGEDAFNDPVEVSQQYRSPHTFFN